MPTDQHGQSPTNYESGHCAAGGHTRCRGDFRTAVCACPCHTAPPPAPPITVTVRCVFGCRAVVDSIDPWPAHEAMEAHYRDRHAADIAAATGGAA